MGIAREAGPVKYFVALLSSDTDLLPRVETDLTRILGAIDARSEILPWTVSKFYEKEMGCGLVRRFVSFEPLASPGKLGDIKVATQQVEDQYRSKTGDRTGRRVNLDPGYVEAGKVVLASTKNAGQRIYLHSGIYAETTLLFYEGAFQASPYTYRDYLWPETVAFLTSLRAAYLDQVRRLG